MSRYDNKPAVWNEVDRVNGNVISVSEGGGFKVTTPDNKIIFTCPAKQLNTIRDVFNSLTDAQIDACQKHAELNKEKAKVAKDMARTAEKGMKYIQALKEAAERAGVNPEDVIKKAAGLK